MAKEDIRAVGTDSGHLAWLIQHDSQEGAWKRLHHGPVVDAYRMPGGLDGTPAQHDAGAVVGRGIERLADRGTCLARLADPGTQAARQYPLCGTIAANRVEARAQRTIKGRGLEPDPAGDAVDRGLLLGRKGPEAANIPGDRAWIPVEPADGAAATLRREAHIHTQHRAHG